MAFNVARVYERMGEVVDGVRFFEIVLAGRPDATLRADVERRIVALRAYDQRRRDGIAQPPPSSDAMSAEGLTWFNRGVTFFQRRQYAQARAAFEQAHYYLQTPELFFNLASTYERLNQFDLAIENLREYLSSRRGTAEEAEVQRRIEALQQRRR
jgi:tetratricopeptide (TPR) repeat protein